MRTDEELKAEIETQKAMFYLQQKENEDFCHFLVQKKRDIMQVLGDKEQN